MEAPEGPDHSDYRSSSIHLFVGVRGGVRGRGVVGGSSFGADRQRELSISECMPQAFVIPTVGGRADTALG